MDRVLLPSELFVGTIYNKEDAKLDDTVVLPDYLFLDAINLELREQITAKRHHDRVVLDALKALKTGGALPMRSALTDWKITNSLVFYKDKCYVPDDTDL